MQEYYLHRWRRGIWWMQRLGKGNKRAASVFHLLLLMLIRFLAILSEQLNLETHARTGGICWTISGKYWWFMRGGTFGSTAEEVGATEAFLASDYNKIRFGNFLCSLYSFAHLLFSMFQNRFFPTVSHHLFHNEEYEKEKWLKLRQRSVSCTWKERGWWRSCIVHACRPKAPRTMAVTVGRGSEKPKPKEIITTSKKQKWAGVYTWGGTKSYCENNTSCLKWNKHQTQSKGKIHKRKNSFPTNT